MYAHPSPKLIEQVWWSSGRSRSTLGGVNQWEKLTRVKQEVLEGGAEGWLVTGIREPLDVISSSSDLHGKAQLVRI